MSKDFEEKIGRSSNDRSGRGNASRTTSHRKAYLFGGFLLLAGGVICIVVGVYASKLNREVGNDKKGCPESPLSQCTFSAEAKRVKLPEFLQKVKEVYYKMYPETHAWEDYIDDDELIKNVQERYLPYDPNPLKLKEKTDQSMALLTEIKSKVINIDELTPRELKTLEQLKHYLQHSFGNPYDENYYNGDWMMGPNFFCWQPFCIIHSQLMSYGYFKVPTSYKDVEDTIAMIMKHKTAIERYRSNIDLGVKAGMVRSVEDCISGVDALKEKSKYLTKTNRSESVLDEEYTAPFQAKDFLDYVPESDLQLWIKNNKKTASSSIKEALTEGFGKPMLDLINYLEHEHIRHCIPSHVSSGLVNLPLKYVYKDGKPTAKRTTRKLPTGEQLDGRKSYKSTVSYFTTADITTDEILEKGKKQNEVFYKEILKITRSIMNSTNTSKAVNKLRKFLSADTQWHNERKFPENESNAKAFKTCVDKESAKKFCPVRYAALKKWIAACREIMALIHPQFIYAFHVTGKRMTLPNCPIEIYPHFNPSKGTMQFVESDETCSSPTEFRLPFFLERYGPKFQEWSVVAHETRPGHHLQAQGMREYFQSGCRGLMSWLDDRTSESFSAFTEGWALYSENPIMSDDTELYNDNPFQKYGMLKWQVWRALRLIIDTGLHDRGMKRDEALQLFDQFAWDSTDFAVKELTRYQSCPGQATAYMIGRLTIMELREKTKRELGEKFSLKDFHYQVLSQGNGPLSFLRKYIEKYIDCVKKDLKTALCQSILEPQKKPVGTEVFSQKRTALKLRLLHIKSRHRHYP
ncbi:uncharacterized protein LOC114522845 [Dendronephthya gigantea]|uniref:uncharacterized protein LOC114522845 n=1 Tax=Dendronephthya gigantea TaxID=151771 RepID=UPI00106A2CF9|nr:uncharacterized protein LOC114522845 [Dendronephthya gigantea]